MASSNWKEEGNHKNMIVWMPAMVMSKEDELNKQLIGLL